MKRFSTLLATAAAAIALSASAHAQMTMKASHQFPGGKGDVRDDMVQMIAKEVEGRQCRPRHPGLSGRLAVQAERPVERHGQRPARHHAVPARLRQRQGAGLQRDADARPDPQPGARQAHQQFAVHEGHPRRDREARRDRAVRRLVCRRRRGQGRLHRQPERHERPQVPRRRSDLRRHVGNGRRQHRQPAVERNLQRVPERRRERHRHQPRHLRSRCGSTK